MIIIEGGTVLTVDDAGQVHAPGHVVIDGDRIVAVGPGRYPGTENVTDTRSFQKIDAAGMVVMPGLVDLHYPSIRALDAETAYWAAASYLESAS